MKPIFVVYGLLATISGLVNGFHVDRSLARPLTRMMAVKEKESTERSVEDATKTLAELPPVIQSIADDRKQYQMNLGKAMDTLRKDMPYILKRKPDFSIYDEKISVIDPSGVQLTGLTQYKSAFAFFQTFIGFWFSPSSRLQYRMVYDFCRSSIRVSWHAVLIPKVPLGRPLHVDGISYYQVDRSSGKINEHRIEQLMINNTPVAPPYGILSLLQQDLLGMRGTVPAGVGAWSAREKASQ